MILIIATSLLSTVATLQDPPPVSGPPTPPETFQVTVTADIDALLDELERSADALRGFTADISVLEEDANLGSQKRRDGHLIYQVDDQGKKRFAARFDGVAVRNTEGGRWRRTPMKKHWVFDGRWLAEINHDAKQFIGREIVPPGRELDPLKLGEGPFPIPIGQPKLEVLRRFDVTRIEAPETGFLAKLPESFEMDGLRLVPRAGTPLAEEYGSLELFYDRVTRLPVGVKAMERNGNITFVRMADPVRNPELSAEQMSQLVYEVPDATEWRIDERPWDGGSS